MLKRYEIVIWLALALRAAHRYTSEPSGGDRQRRFFECEDLLVGRIAATHGVSVDQVVAGTEAKLALPDQVPEMRV